MNTATRMITPRTLGIRFSLSFLSYWQQFVTIGLVVMLVLSAFGLVYAKDLNRRLSIQYQQAQAQRHQYQVAHGKLLLEKSTVSRQSRVQMIAENDLGMVMPSSQNSVLLKVKDLNQTPSYPIYSSNDCQRVIIKNAKTDCFQRQPIIES